MKKVFKYTITPAMQLPEGWKLLTLARQLDTPTLWAEVDPSAPSVEVDGAALLQRLETTKYEVFMTGQEIPDGYEYVATHFTHGCARTAHLYRCTVPAAPAPAPDPAALH